ALALARTIIRRAERRTIAFLEEQGSTKSEVVAYLNRLSSLVFLLEVYEATHSGPGVRLVKAQ
ncbi:ATP:cob(I)alamin adenosyltransferase, partial [Klebsiella variicola]|uniref:ATP:cob(I)alamin adenosyltransferase n=1 Tax=Klebsiella variicola TaxID=244366 RepID=UPI002731C133